MSRFSRINTIWRKELSDTLRDRRTLIAMILVPMVLYPALMLGSLQAFEFQTTRLVREEYHVAVSSENAAHWVRRVIDEDGAHRPGVAGKTAEQIIAEEEEPLAADGANDAAPSPGARAPGAAGREAAVIGVRGRPPKYRLHVVRDVRDAVLTGQTIDGAPINVGVEFDGDVPTPGNQTARPIRIILDETDFRSRIAATGLSGVFERTSEALLLQRLERVRLSPSFVKPLPLQEISVATPEKVGGSILGQVLPLILIVMTITGAIYPAIDLTAGERERGTLETLIAAPVPAVDLITGKFVVVTLIGLLSAVLNLLSIGGTIYLGGLGQILTRGQDVAIPLWSLPWVLLVLIPLAVLFSAILLAVCSFARSFKEAQNYVMPVMVAGLIAAVVGILPGTRLEGPLLIMPVTNITLLTRDLLTGRFDPIAILWVVASTSLMAGAAVAIAARLFGQEAVLFADSASIKTLFQRRFFKPALAPSAAQAFLLVALCYSLNFFAQQSLMRTPQLVDSARFFYAIAAILLLLFITLPLATAVYSRVNVATAFALRPPRARDLSAALLIGGSSWILAAGWFALQQQFFPLPEAAMKEFARIEGWLSSEPLWMIVILLAVVPAFAEEFFFRGFALSGMRTGLGTVGAVVVTALAFGIHHHSVHRLVLTVLLGIVFAILVVRSASLWPAIVAHLLHNGLSVLSQRDDAGLGLKGLLAQVGYVPSDEGFPPITWLLCAGLALAVGLWIACTGGYRQPETLTPPGQPPSFAVGPGRDGEQAAYGAR